MDPVVFGAQRDFMLRAHAEVAAVRPTILVRQPEQLTVELLERCRPQWVILPDWSWLISDDLLARAPFVGFHAADLPAYRGRSSLQHQIIDGLKHTQWSCFRMRSGTDTGPILLQERLALDGTIGEIWERIATLVGPMCRRLLACDYQEWEQGAGGFSRRRRKPEDSRLCDWSAPLTRIYDLRRALDAPYPKVFWEADGKRLRFNRPRLGGEESHAQVAIAEIDESRKP